MPCGERLTKSEQYAHVYQEGRSWANTLLVMKAVPNGLLLSRYGLSVGRRVGGAVLRNRMKRLLREILRLTPVKVGWDIIFMVRPVAAGTDYAAMEKAVRELLSRARLLSQ